MEGIPFFCHILLRYFDSFKKIQQFNPFSHLQVRPIMVPRDVQILPWFTGYAEAINAGKSVRNEDQAAFHRGVLRTMDADSRVQFTGKLFYF